MSSLQAASTLANDSSSSSEPLGEDISRARFHEYPLTLNSSCDREEDKALNVGERGGEIGVRGLNRFVSTLSNCRKGPRRIMSRR